jgi:hypothetical protein
VASELKFKVGDQVRMTREYDFGDSLYREGDVVKVLEIDYTDELFPYLIGVDGVPAHWMVPSDLEPIPVTDAPDLLAGALMYLDGVKDLLAQKNAAYGNSAGNPVRIFSRADDVEQLRVRIDDKLSRVARGGPDATTEELINDLIGYLALLGAKLRGAK